MTKVITIKDLEKQTGMKGRVIRRVIRGKVKIKAPLVEGKGRFYGFEEGSSTLSRVRKALREHQASASEEKKEEAPAA